MGRGHRALSINSKDMLQPKSNTLFMCQTTGQEMGLSWGAQLAQSVQHTTVDLRVVSGEFKPHVGHCVSNSMLKERKKGRRKRREGGREGRK